MIKLPDRTLEKLDELQELIDQHPINIPAYALARFMEIDADGLRRALDEGSAPFGFGWKNLMAENRAFEFPTYTFGVWYTGGAIDAS